MRSGAEEGGVGTRKRGRDDERRQSNAPTRSRSRRTVSRRAARIARRNATSQTTGATDGDSDSPGCAALRVERAVLGVLSEAKVRKLDIVVVLRALEKQILSSSHGDTAIRRHTARDGRRTRSESRETVTCRPRTTRRARVPIPLVVHRWGDTVGGASPSVRGTACALTSRARDCHARAQGVLCFGAPSRIMREESHASSARGGLRSQTSRIAIDRASRARAGWRRKKRERSGATG